MTVGATTQVVITAGGGEAVQVMRDLLRVKVTAGQTGGAFLGVGSDRPGGRRSAAASPCALRGVARARADPDARCDEGAEVTAALGDTVFVLPHAPHTYRNEGRDRARFVAVLSPGGYESFFAELGDCAPGPMDPAPMARPPDLAASSR